MQQPNEEASPKNELLKQAIIEAQTNIAKQLIEDLFFISGQIATTNLFHQLIQDKQALEAIKMANHKQTTLAVTQSALFIGMFAGLKSVLQSPLLKTIIFPLAIVFDIIAAYIVTKTYHNAKNRNNAHMAALFVSVTLTATTTTAVLDAMLETWAPKLILFSGSLVPYIFVGALALAATYHLMLTIFHGIMACKAVGENENSALTHEEHKRHVTHFTNNLFITVKLAAVIVAIVGLMILQWTGAPATIALAVVCSMLGFGIVKAIHDACKKKSAATIIAQDANIPSNDNNEYKHDDADSLLNNPPNPSKFRVFYRQHRAKNLASKSLDKQQLYLDSAITAKLNTLTAHSEKHDALSALLNLIKNENQEMMKFTGIEQFKKENGSKIHWQPEFFSLKRSVFSSQFRQDSDTQDLIEAVVLYVHNWKRAKLHAGATDKNIIPSEEHNNMLCVAQTTA